MKTSWISHVRVGLILCLLTLALVQLYRWQGFALRASSLQVKSIFLSLDPEELLELGAMCNSLEKYACSKDYFEKVVHRFPRNLPALANLGIVLGRLGEFGQSRLALKSYFRRGGQAYDAMFWMGKSLSGLGQAEKALRWYYQSLSRSPDRILVATELIDELMSLGRHEEALSVLASATRGKPNKDPFWRSKLDSLVQYIAKADAELSERRYKIRLPALDGKHHFVPVRGERGQNDFQFFLLDSRVKDISVTEDFILGQNSKLSEDLGYKKSQGLSLTDLRIKLPVMKVGPWELKDVEVRICKSCQPRIGNAIFEKLEMKKMQDENIQFALLTKK